jgi:serine/threonine-protein kinase
MPNQPEVEEIAGSVALTQGRWDDALRALERARLLTPNRIVHRMELAQAYRLLRRYGEYDAVIAEMIRNCGGDPGTLIFDAANGRFDSHGDTRFLREAFATLQNKSGLAASDRDELSILFALVDRDPNALDRALAASTQARIHIRGTPFPKAWYAALGCRMRGDSEGMQRALTEARADVEQSFAGEPQNARALSLLALIDAGLGRAEEAVQAAQRACELSASSAPDAPVAKCSLAAVYAWTGQIDLAFATLEPLVRQPAGRAEPSQPSYGDFRLNPIWDPLRSDPRFRALMQQLTPPATDR